MPDAGPVMLSSISSILSINEHTIPAKIPAKPIFAPITMQSTSIPAVPSQVFVLLLYLIPYYIRNPVSICHEKYRNDSKPETPVNVPGKEYYQTPAQREIHIIEVFWILEPVHSPVEFMR